MLGLPLTPTPVEPHEPEIDSEAPEPGRPRRSDAGPVPTAPPGEPDDHALVRLAQGGDETAFAHLVRRHQDRAWRVARNLVGNREDASDLAQEAFVRVFKALERFDFQHEFSTWLYRIVTNLAIDHLRRRRPIKSTAVVGPEGDDEAEFDLHDDEADGPSDALEREETAEAVRSCIESLAPHFATVMALRELEGLPCTEIAEIVGATHVTVRWRLHRGRKLFQEEWERRARLAQVRSLDALETAQEELGANTETHPPVDPPARSS